MAGSYAKGEKPRDLDAAKGGGVLGRTRDFLKEEVEFRRPDEGKRQSADVVGELADGDQKYAKSGAGAGNGEYGGAPKAKGKSLPAIAPRK